ncbi:hypothetical protein PAXRUDRAFT_586776 [Paxillus rubicundulus Ve08.2h10]|uniref:Unplaced genomic scaffold scaffold_479, whole genome shotgun sequence n=1 Tax=Paxillus rubicundulus Ve08.2h10 TaxID=930991 RepID=A0A0D0DTX0_9AGAM|nr:hypothetical protein PAXRUDRAFT_586776 [Paxillus rubicundulus Ve08.2h10]
MLEKQAAVLLMLILECTVTSQRLARPSLYISDVISFSLIYTDKRKLFTGPYDPENLSVLLLFVNTGVSTVSGEVIARRSEDTFIIAVSTTKPVMIPYHAYDSLA